MQIKLFLDQDQLAEAVRQHPLPDHLEDGVYNVDKIAEALDVSLPTAGRFLKAGMPAIESGAMGRPWKIRLSIAWAWLEVYRKQRAEEKLGPAQRRRLQIKKFRDALRGA
ncbi:hypothetical protein ACU8MX_18340 [Rhizobium leguminosarum]